MNSAKYTALEIYNHHLSILNKAGTFEPTENVAKECARFTIHECYRIAFTTGIKESYFWWEEVKQEIEKL